ncbi:MAG: thioredoxin fold domain-containing protein [Gammaproteobacteria bacterium]|nr:thioredoxin fold domain-containing protein [Gammaproteobacteria bacterium]
MYIKHAAQFNKILILSISLLFIWSASDAAPVARGKLTGGLISEHPGWFKESFLDIADDVNQATDAGKHVILFMYLDNCPYCHRMIEENFKHAPYTDFIQKNFDVIALNIKGDREIAFNAETSVSEKALASLLKVRYTPTIIFLNSDNKTVLRLNGYRSVRDFGYAIEYVQQKAYLKSTLSQYIDSRPPEKQYNFRSHPQLRQITDLQSVAANPLAILFEDIHCDLCDLLHDGHLKSPGVRSVLENFTFVRLDALSDTPIIDPEGNKTTPREFAEKLGLNYRPGIVLYDRGREVSRIDGMLYSYHFEETLRYVGERHYEKYPKSFYEYLAVRTEQLLAEGKDVDLSK